MHSRLRSLKAVTVTFSAALALGACGQGEPPTQAVAGALPKTSASPSGDGTREASPIAGGKGEQVAGSTVELDAFAQMLDDAITKGRTAKIALGTTGENVSTSTGLADFRTSTPALRLSTAVAAMDGQKAEVLLVDGVVYLRMGNDPSAKYMKMELAQLGAAANDLAQLDPRAGYKRVSPSFTGLTYVGEKAEGGEQLHHYRATVDPAAQKKGGVFQVQAYDAWFDDAGQLRRIVADIGGTVSTLTYSGWGRKLDLKAPPSKEVVELPS